MIRYVVEVVDRHLPVVKKEEHFFDSVEEATQYYDRMARYYAVRLLEEDSLGLGNCPTRKLFAFHEPMADRNDVTLDVLDEYRGIKERSIDDYFAEECDDLF